MKEEQLFASYLPVMTSTGFQTHQLDKSSGKYWLPYHDQYVLLIWSKGEASFDGNLLSGQIGPDQLLFAQPGELRQVILAPNAKGMAISFGRLELDQALGSDNLFQRMLQYLTQKKQAFSINTNAAVRQTLDLINATAAGPIVHRADIQFAYLKILLLQAVELPGQQEMMRPNRNQQLVSQFFQLLDDHYKQIKMVSDYAEKLAVTPNYLNEVIKKETGRSAGQHIRSRVVREAKQQAKRADVGMKAIAYDLGFLDMAHFSKFFKNTTGFNFSDYKKMGSVALPN